MSRGSIWDNALGSAVLAFIATIIGIIWSYFKKRDGDNPKDDGTP